MDDLPEFGADLPTFDVDSLPTFYGGALPSKQARSASKTVAADRAHRWRAKRRTFQDERKAANAHETIILPGPGESLTLVMSGQSDAWHYVEAIAAKLGKVAELVLCSLGFNEAVHRGLLRMLDAGQVASVTLMTSVYFRSVDSEIFDELHADLTKRGQAIVARRNHAKLALFGASDGRRLVWDSSANLRSCRNAEVATLTHDAGLHAFHRGWIMDVVATGTEK